MRAIYNVAFFAHTWCMRMVCLLVLLVPFFSISAQSSNAGLDLIPVIIPEGTTYLSRYNLRVYRNETYQGLRYVELSGQLERGSGSNYNASFWRVSETKRDLRAISAPIDGVQRYSFSLNELLYTDKPLGGEYPEHLYFFPEYRNFPLLPSAVLYRLTGPGIPQSGRSYEAFAYRLSDPDGDGEFTPIQVYVRYTYRGIGEYLGETVHFFDADFALRSDGRLTGFAVQGGNKVSIAVFPGDETRVFMRNTISENYQLRDRSQLRIEGFGLTWIRSPQPIYNDREFLDSIAALPGTRSPDLDPNRLPTPNRLPNSNPLSDPNPERLSNSDSLPSSSPLPNSDLLPEHLPDVIQSSAGPIEVSTDPLGLKFSVPNIQFKADSTELAAGEAERIGILADILKKASGRRFLIVGHSADVGRPEGQLQLSRERAARIVELLGKEGIIPGTMRYEGRGAREPVADNATAEGRAANRRVEAIILN